MDLIDTNVVSELRKVRSGRAAPEVIRWNASVDAADLYLSVITLYEIETGILLKSRRDPAQGAIMREWFEHSVRVGFAGRILDLTEEIAARAAALQTIRTFDKVDSFLAATAYVHRMRIVTRNVHHFEGAGIEVVNPWNLP